MSPEDAHDLLGTRSSDSPDRIVAAFYSRGNELLREIEVFGITPSMVKKRRIALERLDEAWQVLRPEGAPDKLEEALLQQQPKPVVAVTNQAATSGPIIGSADRQQVAPPFSQLKKKLQSLPSWALPAAGVVTGALVLLVFVVSQLSEADPIPATGGQPDSTAVSVSDLLKEAASRLLEGDHLAALLAYRKVIDQEPTNALALQQMAELSAVRGKLQVISEPPGAAVEITEDRKGATTFGRKESPATFDELPLGNYQIHVQQAGYEALPPIKVTVSGTRTVQVPAALQRQVGTLAIVSDPPGKSFVATLIRSPAENNLDAVERKGKTEAVLEKIPTGTYRVTLTDSNESREVDVRPSSRTELAFVGNGVPTQKQSGTLNLTTDKTTYRNGESVVCRVEVPKEGHLRVYSIDAKGFCTQIYPNRFVPDDRVRAGSMIAIPEANAGYQLQLELPDGMAKGSESVEAVFSTQPFSDTGRMNFAEASFLSLGALPVETLRERGLANPQAALFGTATYLVNP